MTTIVFRDGIIAADNQVTSEGGTRLGTRAKLLRIGDGVFGFAGDVNAVERASTYLRALYGQSRGFAALFGHIPHRPDLPEGSVTVIEVSRRGVRMYGASLFPEPIAGPYFAIGSGRDFALGALAMGATAAEAVRAAIQFDVYSGGPIQALSLVPCEPESGVRK